MVYGLFEPSQGWVARSLRAIAALFGTLRLVRFSLAILIMAWLALAGTEQGQDLMLSLAENIVNFWQWRAALSVALTAVVLTGAAIATWYFARFLISAGVGFGATSAGPERYCREHVPRWLGVGVFVAPAFAALQLAESMTGGGVWCPYIIASVVLAAGLIGSARGQNVGGVPEASSKPCEDLAATPSTAMPVDIYGLPGLTRRAAWQQIFGRGALILVAYLLAIAWLAIGAQAAPAAGDLARLWWTVVGIAAALLSAAAIMYVCLAYRRRVLQPRSARDGRFDPDHFHRWPNLEETPWRPRYGDPGPRDERPLLSYTMEQFPWLVGIGVGAMVVSGGLAAASYFAPWRLADFGGSPPLFFAWATGLLPLLALLAIAADRVDRHCGLQHFPILSLLIGYAVLLSLFDLTDNHRVRPAATLSNSAPISASNVAPAPAGADDAASEQAQHAPSFAAQTADCNSTPVAGTATLRDAAVDWLCRHGITPGTARSANQLPQPVFVVATQGGGSTSAWWTAHVLQRLDHENPSFADRVFAISSVSGGSLGAGAFVATLACRSDGSERQMAMLGGLCPNNPQQPDMVEMVSRDFLTPVLSRTLFLDFWLRFIPASWVNLPQFDRATGLEEAWNHAGSAALHNNVFAARFTAPWDLRRPGDRSLPWLPILLLNSTNVETGRRMVVSPVRVSSRQRQGSCPSQPFGDALAPFANALDWVVDIGADYQPIAFSTAVNLSARFPIIEPAASAEGCPPGASDSIKMRFVDGGYFENGGLVSAADAVRTLLMAAGCEGGNPSGGQGASKCSILPIVITIENDTQRYRLEGDHCVLRPLDPRYSNGEVRSPIRALLASRQAHGDAARVELRRLLAPYESQMPRLTATGGPQGSAETVPSVPTIVPFRLVDRSVTLPTGWSLSSAAIAAMRSQYDDSQVRCPVLYASNTTAMSNVESAAGVRTLLGIPRGVADEVVPGAAPNSPVTGAPGATADTPH